VAWDGALGGGPERGLDARQDVVPGAVPELELDAAQDVERAEVPELALGEALDVVLGSDVALGVVPALGEALELDAVLGSDVALGVVLGLDEGLAVGSGAALVVEWGAGSDAALVEETDPDVASDVGTDEASDCRSGGTAHTCSSSSILDNSRALEPAMEPVQVEGMEDPTAKVPDSSTVWLRLRRSVRCWSNE